MIESKKRIKNKYNILCVKLLNYLNRDEAFDDMEKAFSNENSILNIFQKVQGISNLEILGKVILILEYLNNLKDKCLLSLYFSKYPYLVNLLSF